MVKIPLTFENPALYYLAFYTTDFSKLSLWRDLLCPAFMSHRTNSLFFLSQMYYFLISKWAGYKLPGVKQFICGFRGLCESYGFTAVKNSKTSYRTEAGPRELLSELATLLSPVTFEVRVSLGKLAISPSVP